MPLIITNEGPPTGGEVVFGSPSPPPPPPCVCIENLLRWDLGPEQFRRTTAELTARSRKVHDAVGSLDLDGVTLDNTLKALAHAEAEYTVQRNMLTFPWHVAPGLEVRNASADAREKLSAFDDDMSMRKDVYQRIVALGMKVDEGALTAEDRRYMERLLGESIGELRAKTKRREEVDARGLDTEARIETYLETSMEARSRGLLLPKEKQNQVKCINKQININLQTITCDQTNAALESVVRLHAQKSALLGFKSYADYALRRPMAKSAQAVSTFLDELTHELKPNRVRERRSARAAVRRPPQLREYFPAEVVTRGLLGICRDLLGLSFSPVHGAPAWHPDVTAYAVADGASGQPLGQFYLDLFAREGKSTFPYRAFCAPLQPSCLLPDGSRRTAVAAVVTNFTRDTLLEHDDVQVYFHEFGHVMHFLCARAEHAVFSARDVTAWEFVEVPSQMLENWAWEKEPLRRISRHYETGAPIPDDLLDDLVKNRSTADNMSQCLARSKFDQALHTQTGLDPAEVYARLSEEMLRVPGYRRSDIPPYRTLMDPSYIPYLDAHFYRYLWGEVLSTDMFHSRFKREGVMNPEVGLDYRKCILTPGASKDAYEMVKDFLGRAPNQEAFLLSKRSGEKNEKKKERKHGNNSKTTIGDFAISGLAPKSYEFKKCEK